MRSSQWRLQEAKTQFSRVVDAALRGEPQHITRNGKQAVVVLSEQAFESLQQSALAAAPGFIAHLLAMPRDKDAENETDVERASLALRDVYFMILSSVSPPYALASVYNVDTPRFYRYRINIGST